MMTVKINEETLQDIINIETGLLYPLVGFMGKTDFKSVVDNYTMEDGQVFTIPITLDVPMEIYQTAAKKGWRTIVGWKKKRGFYTGSDYGCLF